jgi:hypothetical protein
MRRGLPLLLYVALALASYYPQSLHPRDSVAYVGDALESVYIVAWNVHQFFGDPIHLFDANVLHPNAHALALTDHRLLPSLLVAPVVWATGNPVLAYNVAILAASLLAALGARHLARVLGCDAVGAWTAGALYAFHTYQIHEASRLNIIFHGFLPVMLAELLLLLRTGEKHRAWRTALFLLLQGLSSNYHLLYAALTLALVALAALAARPRLVAARLLALIAPGVVALALFAPIALTYLQVARSHAHERALPLSMGLEHYVSTSPSNLVYGAIGAEVRTQQRGPHFVGFLSLALALLGLVFSTRRRDAAGQALLAPSVWAPASAGLALLLVALSLGRNVVLWGRYLAPGPYRLLYAFVPGFRLVRIPERLGLLAMLFVALLVALALSELRRRGWGKAVLPLALLVPLEHLSPKADVERVPVGREIPQVYRWLASSPAKGVAEVPIRGEGLVREETLEMYFSTAHWKPLVHGYVAYPPQITRLLRRAAAQVPAEVSLQAFGRVGVDTVVVHCGREAGLDLYRQVPGTGAEKQERFRKLLRLAGLDVFDQLPQAVAAGRIVRAARFEGEAARVHEGSADEVYRILPAPARAAARFPQGATLREPGLRYRARRGEPALAGDGRLETSWESVEPLTGDESFEVELDRPRLVQGVVLPLRWDSVYPTRFRIDGRDASGRWLPLARYGEAQVLQLLDRLIEDPGHAAMGFAWEPHELLGLRLAVEAGGTSFEGWSIPEIEIKGP